MLNIENLEVSIEDKKILKGLSFVVKPGEVHAVMGPNGAGKSTLARVIAGDPNYAVIDGDIVFNGESLIDLEPEERAQKGLFMSFQYPVEISGITNFQFLHAAYNAVHEDELTEDAFRVYVLEKCASMKMDIAFLDRDLNSGFSGGEKKRNEILQLLVLNPKVAILDETDSGLDIDAMKIVSSGVNHFMNKEKGLVLITHYQRLLDYIRPDFVHVVIDGRVVMSGGPELALKLEKEGYDWLEETVTC
ncbi:MAG: Fe-S cluster assembly ATPase SufC [Simkaniaceae bacterium]|nr:Fe-S cluster assembly ATPase SufC [Simkaniaceae bacterium]